MQLGRIDSQTYEKLGSIAAQYVFDQIKEIINVEELEDEDKKKVVDSIMKAMQVSISITSEFCVNDYLNLDKLDDVYELMENDKFKEAHDRMIE